MWNSKFGIVDQMIYKNEESMKYEMRTVLLWNNFTAANNAMDFSFKIINPSFLVPLLDVD